ncbi:putative Xaa-Pro aminopeptidase P [Zancudomyces culisetae]|uniref:Putative Xaa-Pro aminopeptidase P n=1 Tax=Zancudomyces culisetae TaxID=1213189 RepID=A0A1R1PMJ1_ZANCU|nr:putative Xaa-Pro aminopeptidase P [Zancudomyces culisetae]|eukprot:OMH82112.1 putative Xaa-Pro aminopeptidase P [Zancudomyces culisetae]
MSTTSDKGSTNQAVDTTTRLKELRELMKLPEFNVDAYIVPSEDAHQSEYVADSDMRRGFISGFTGSAGTAVITKDSASMFTDGRYFLMARKQMDSNWTLMKVGVTGVPTLEKYLEDLPEGNRIGVDPTLLSASRAEALCKSLKDKKKELVPISENLVDKVWRDKPGKPDASVFELGIEFAGLGVSAKLEKVRREMDVLQGSSLVIAALDQIAWLFNLRGSDISYNPLFFSYSIVTQEEAYIFMDERKLTENAKKSLSGVNILPYDAIFEHLKKLPPVAQSTNKKILVDAGVSWALVDVVGTENTKQCTSPITNLKAIKNETEIKGMRQSHIKDGVAMAKWYVWLENELMFNGGHLRLSECDVADKLEQFRREQEHCVGLSFDTISSVGPNAAVIHYSPQRGEDLKLDVNQIYLVDSGGQYLDGTTDVTRTWHFGSPSAWERECFTRVLKGHIALDSVVFPTGVSGFALDPLARTALWEAGLDYRHGTGHGIGSFLNVHEGPHGIAMRPAQVNVGFKAGMIITNEPGYYEDGKFGIRIENTCLVVKKDTPNRFGDVDYLTLESLTLCPIQRNLIMASILTQSEIEWINSYHKRVFDTLSPLLEDDKPALEWLKKNTGPI